MKDCFSLKKFQGRADLDGHVQNYIILIQKFLVLLDVVVQRA